MQHFSNDAVIIGDVAALAIANTDYRKVVSTTSVQVVLYALRPSETLPMETHRDGTQILHVVRGSAKVFIGDKSGNVLAGGIVVLSPGTAHRVKPYGGADLKMWSVYTSPEFAPDRVDKRQPATARTNESVFALGRGFAPGMTIDVADGGGVCIAQYGTPVCEHTHTDLNALTKRLTADVCSIACPTCDAEVGAHFPRLRKKKKKKTTTRPSGENVAEWLILRPQPSTRGVSGAISVVKEDGDKHPWAGETDGTNMKYALSATIPLAVKGLEETAKGAHQGVRLLLEQYDQHAFSTKNVPTKYPFYITSGAVLGGYAPKIDPLRLKDDGIPEAGGTKNTPGKMIAFTVPEKTGVNVWSYQCTQYKAMGGPISVYAHDTRPVFNPKDNTIVLQNIHTNAFVIMKEGVDDHVTGLDFDAMLQATHMVQSAVPAFRAGALSCATIVPRKSNISAVSDDSEPAVLLRSGRRVCDHVHTLGNLKQRLAARADSPCINCFVST